MECEGPTVSISMVQSASRNTQFESAPADLPSSRATSAKASAPTGESGARRAPRAGNEAKGMRMNSHELSNADAVYTVSIVSDPCQSTTDDFFLKKTDICMNEGGMECTIDIKSH